MEKNTRRSFLATSALGLTGVAGISKALAEEKQPQLPPPDTKTTFRLTRDIPVEEGYDLIVAGGGPAGAAAAIGAARLGAKVLLLEATGCLGGMGTGAFVSRWSHLGNGESLVVGGLILEMVKSLCRDGNVEPAVLKSFQKNEGRNFSAVGFQPEPLKLLLDKLCREAGVEVRYFTRVIDADVDQSKSSVRGVVANNIEGCRYFRARTFIDGTGDAVLAEMCGAKSRTAGRDTPNIMPPTLCAAVAEIDFSQFSAGRQQAMVEKAIADGFFTQPDRHVPGIMRNGPTTATMNAGHLFHTNALDTRSLSDAMERGRRLVQEYAEFYRKYMPGCENMKVLCSGSLLGVRESRRIVGEYELNYDDFKARRHFPDQIAIYCKGVDIHVYDATPEEYQRYRDEYAKADRLKKGESYGIPYGILVPKGWANLWVAGRCASSDVKVHGAIRDQPGCSMMGQAAGAAAVQSLRTGQPANDLDTEQLVFTLRKAGANLPQEKTSKTMTRNA